MYKRGAGVVLTLAAGFAAVHFSGGPGGAQAGGGWRECCVHSFFAKAAAGCDGSAVQRWLYCLQRCRAIGYGDS